MSPEARTATSAVVVIMLAPLGTAGCDASDTGEVLVVGAHQQELVLDDLERVVVTITGDGLSVPIEQQLAEVDGTWRGIIGGVPVGTDRVFDARGYDDAGALLFAGRADGVTISRGGSAFVALLLQQVSPPAAEHEAVPIIDAVVASRAEVAEGELVSLSVRAHDPDGDPLSFAWDGTAGSFSDPTSSDSDWSAPLSAPPDGEATLEIRVSDGGASSSMSLTIRVGPENARGTASVTAAFNRWPEVYELTASEGRIDVGGSTEVSVHAEDPDGDPLAFLWSASCPGSFGEPTAAASSFTLVDPSLSGSCELRVEVDDGRGGTNFGTLAIQTGPAPSVLLAPQIESTFVSSEATMGGRTVVLRVVATDPQGGALAFSWIASDGELTEPDTAEGTSEVAWTTPLCPEDVPSVMVTVTSTAGVETRHAFLVQVECAIRTMSQTLTDEADVIVWDYNGDVRARYWNYQPYAPFDPSLGTFLKAVVHRTYTVDFELQDGVDDSLSIRMYFNGAGANHTDVIPVATSHVERDYRYVYEDESAWLDPGWGYYFDSVSESTPYHVRHQATLTYHYLID